MSRGEVILLSFILVLVLVGTIMSLGFRYEDARRFPLVWGSATVIVIVFYMVASSVTSLRQRFRMWLTDELIQLSTQTLEGSTTAGAVGGGEQGEEVEDVPEMTAAEKAGEQRFLAMILGLLVVFGVVAWVIGLTIAIPAYMVLMLRGLAKESWSTTLGVTAGVLAFIYLFFAVILNMPLHWGLLDG